MTERFFSAEDALDLCRWVFPIDVFTNKATGETIVTMKFLGTNGWMEISSKAKAGSKYDYYDQMYALMRQAAQVVAGEVPDDPIEFAEPGVSSFEKLLGGDDDEL